MENQKRLTDAEILLNVINAVKLTKNGFATKCKYKSAMSIYNILEGRNGISDDMAARITQAFPEVSYNFIQTGRGDVLRLGASPILPKEHYPMGGPEKPKSNLEDFAVIPGALLRIEKLLEQILLEQRKTPLD
jgi:hypothetical protein